MTIQTGDCRGCARPMRRGRDLLTEHPGTVQYSGHGYCCTCAKRKRAAGEPLKQPRPDVDVTATIQSLTAYLQWRAPFRAKTGAQ
jgi:hypothetical protein